MMSREGKFTSSAPPLSKISVERPFPTAAQQARGEAEHSGPTKLRRQKSELGAAEGQSTRQKAALQWEKQKAGRQFPESP